MTNLKYRYKDIFRKRNIRIHKTILSHTLCYDEDMLVACLSTHRKAASLSPIGSNNNASCAFGILVFPWGKVLQAGKVGVWYYFSGVLPMSANA